VKRRLAFMCAIMAAAALPAASFADGLSATTHYWYAGQNGKLSEGDCKIQAAAALSQAGFRHVAAGTGAGPAVYGDKGTYQAVVLCLGDSGAVAFVVMGEDQDVANSLSDAFVKAWKSQ
jgi:hypothetical protein